MIKEQNKYRRKFFFSLIVFYSVNIFSQTVVNYIKLTDTTINIGVKLISRIIFFDPEKSTLKKVSAIYLDSLVTFLNKYPGIHIEIQNYGREGNYESALTLPKKRAQEIRDYLVNKGISNDRLYAEGLYCTLQKPGKQKGNNKKTKKEVLKCDLRTEFLIIAK